MVAEEAQRPTTPPAERLAGRLVAAEPRRSPTARTKAATALAELGQLDRAIYRAVAGTPTPMLDPPLRQLSRLADRSRLWIAIAAAMAAVGGREGRRAAAAGLVAVAVDSAVVNVGFKLVARRRRPDRDAARVPADR